MGRPTPWIPEDPRTMEGVEVQVHGAHRLEWTFSLLVVLLVALVMLGMALTQVPAAPSPAVHRCPHNPRCAALRPDGLDLLPSAEKLASWRTVERLDDHLRALDTPLALSQVQSPTHATFASGAPTEFAKELMAERAWSSLPEQAPEHPLQQLGPESDLELWSLSDQVHPVVRRAVRQDVLALSSGIDALWRESLRAEEASLASRERRYQERLAEHEAEVRMLSGARSWLPLPLALALILVAGTWRARRKVRLEVSAHQLCIGRRTLSLDRVKSVQGTQGLVVEMLDGTVIRTRSMYPLASVQVVVSTAQQALEARDLRAAESRESRQALEALRQ